MNRDILESLLMDQAFGELSADCQQLLTAYLEEHPEYDSLAKSIQETAVIGHKVAAVSKQVSLPVFSDDRFKVSQRHYKLKLQSRWWFSIAACLMIGFSMGVFLPFGDRQDESTNLIEDLTSISAQAKVHSAGLESARAFWSARTYIKEIQKNRTEWTDNKSDSAMQKRIREFKKGDVL